jgi:hypothetical protein
MQNQKIMNTPNPFPPRRGTSAVCGEILRISGIRAALLLSGLCAWCALVFCFQHVQAAPAPAAESSSQLTIELRDGSRVVAKSLDDSVSFHSPAMGDLKLTWAGIRSIEYAAGTNSARLTTTNGDAFTVMFATDALRVETGFGQTTLPVKLIRSLKVSAAPKSSAPAAGEMARLTIQLRDGSRVAGKGLDDTLNFHSSAMGDLKLTWAGIRSIVYATTNADFARLTATNGDVYEVQFAAPSVSVETGFGKTDLPVKLIRSLTVSAGGGSGQPASGLVARWSGDGNAKDSAGQFDGKVSGGLRYVPGPTGQAFQFNGGDAKVDFGNNVGNFGTNDFTIACWLKTDSKIPLEAFLEKRPECNGNPKAWMIQLIGRRAGEQQSYFKIGITGGTGGLDSLHPVNDGQWHHIAFVRQFTGFEGTMWLVYLDGSLDNSRAYPGETVDLVNQTSVLLGHSVCECCDGTKPYSGAVADVQIYNQALSAYEIQAIFNEGKADR